MKYAAALATILVACHGSATPAVSPPVSPPVAPPVSPPQADFLRDTTLGVVHYTSGHNFDTRKPAARDSLAALLKAQRALWKAAAPANQRFLLRVQCFCPGRQTWSLVEVRAGQLRAWDSSGKQLPARDWTVFTIDQLYENLQRGIQQPLIVNIAFDPRWHFPSYARTSLPVLPDGWSITEIRGFKPN